MKYAIFEGTDPVAVPFIAEYIRGKRVYEVGAGDGLFAQALAPYCKYVRAIEVDPDLAKRCRLRGIDTFEQDFMSSDFADADVIFAFLNPVGMWALGRKLQLQQWHGTIISHTWPLRNKWMKEVQPKEVIEVYDYDTYFPILIYDYTAVPAEIDAKN